MSISPISPAPEFLQTIEMMGRYIVKSGMVYRQQNGFLFSRGREKRDFIQKVSVVINV
jgi:hypothetical protein